MKKITKILGSVILTCGILFSACSDMLDTGTDRYVLTEDNKLKAANDSLYSVVGIMKQLRYIGDRYVVLGELRADLMDITPNADQFLKDINDIKYYDDGYNANENPYLTSKEYFSVINNCNYYIQNVDTSIIVGGKDVMLMEYAVVKALRAWTYMQLALNYKEVPYIELPILTVEDMNRQYPIYNIYELADVLIKDLEKYEALRYPDYAIVGGNIGSYQATYSFIPISYLLGDLYLWKGDYVNAAIHYHQLIMAKITPDPRRTYSLTRYISRWNMNPLASSGNIFSGNCSYATFFNQDIGGEAYSMIVDRSGTNADILNIEAMTLLPRIETANTYKLLPSKVAMDNWNEETYTYFSENDKKVYYFPGDMRGNLTEMYPITCAYGAYYYNTLQNGDTVPVINKYRLTNSIYVYRNATLMLRYAEAINQLGKPSLAMAVLKYGMTEANITNPNYVDPAEIEGTRPPYLDFSDLTESQVNTMIGIHQRGAGDVQYDTLNYVLPKFEDLSEGERLAKQMEHVEDLIIKELALETAFEGNRFHDLMRFAIRRNDNNILADRVAQKNKNAGDKLRDSKYWYLPSKYVKIPEPNPSLEELVGE